MKVGALAALLFTSHLRACGVMIWSSFSGCCVDFILCSLVGTEGLEQVPHKFCAASLSLFKDSRDSQEPRATVDSPAGMALEDCR